MVRKVFFTLLLAHGFLGTVCPELEEQHQQINEIADQTYRAILEEITEPRSIRRRKKQSETGDIAILKRLLEFAYKDLATLEDQWLMFENELLVELEKCGSNESAKQSLLSVFHNRQDIIEQEIEQIERVIDKLKKDKQLLIIPAPLFERPKETGMQEKVLQVKPKPAPKKQQVSQGPRRSRSSATGKARPYVMQRVGRTMLRMNQAPPSNPHNERRPMARPEGKTSGNSRRQSNVVAQNSKAKETSVQSSSVNRGH